MLEHRLSESLETKSENERLFLQHQEGKRLEREGKRICDSVRKDVDERLARGELVGYSDAYLAYQESEKFSADMDALVADLGPDIALRVCTVDSAKLKKLIEVGLVKADAPYITKSVTASLVTKTITK